MTDPRRRGESGGRAVKAKMNNFKIKANLTFVTKLKWNK